MRLLSRLFLRGLAALVPLGGTLFLLYWIGSGAENLLGPGLRRLLPEGAYVPGLGVLAGLLAVLLAGALMTTFLFRWLLSLGERMVERIPLVQTVYGAIRDTVQLFAGDERRGTGRPVLVPFGPEGSWCLGFLTREDLSATSPDLAERVAVYVPLAYQIGGLTLLLPRSQVRPLSLGAEEALRFALTAGMSGETPSSAP